MAVDIPGVISIVVFYVIILAVGIWAGRNSARSGSATQVFLADRNMGLIVSFFTLTATMVGGAFINGTAEIIATSGLAWTVAPIGYCTGMFIGGMCYAPKMRRAGYVTMFDPFQEVYGIRVGALMCIPQFMGDVFWTAAVLSALGSTISVIMELDNTLSIILSAVIAIVYTFLGGLWSVAYTDVVQLLCIAIGLAIACPFTVHHPAVDMASLGGDWLGRVAPGDTGRYLDLLGVVALGGIPWQVYFQRVLACRSAANARMSSCVAAVMCLLFAVPPAIMGLAGRAADWNQTAYGDQLSPEDYSFILPLTLQYLCPPAVAVLGIGTLSAAVMSSADSSILASATVFTNNMYKNAIRPAASDREMVWVLRAGIVVVGMMSTAIAVSVKSIYGLYVMCSDLMYVILFPQFTSVLFIPGTNPYGGLAGFFISMPLRLLSGEPLISMPALIKYPFYDEVAGQGFPFRSVAMLSGFLAIVVVSAFTNLLFGKGWLPAGLDVLGFFSRAHPVKLSGSVRCGLKKEAELGQELVMEKKAMAMVAMVVDGVEENGLKTVAQNGCGEEHQAPLLTNDTSLPGPTRA